MEKLIYLLNRSPDMPSMGAAVLDEVVPKLRSKGAYRVTANIADINDAVAKANPGRFGGPWDTLGAAVSFWLDNLDARRAIEPDFAEISAGFSGYLVTESVVQGYERSWADGDRRPGVTLFSAIGKPPAVSDEHFYHWWQDVHSQSSFRLHPCRWSYVRNAVARPLTPGAPAYRAIVLEHWRDFAEFTDDSRFFGGKAALAEMYAEIPHYCDNDTMISGPMSEYSFAWDQAAC